MTRQAIATKVMALDFLAPRGEGALPSGMR